MKTELFIKNPPRITHRQTSFLRSLLKKTPGPLPSDWPSPVVLRRWLRRPTFLAALNTLRLSHLRQRFPAAAHDPTDHAVHERLIDMLNLIHPDANARQALEFFEQRILDAQQPFDDSQPAHIARRQAALAHIQNLASTPSLNPKP
jgi:hypothetical protein